MPARSAAGKRATMPMVMMSEIPLPDAALGDLIAQPHQKKCAGRQRNHGYNSKCPAEIIHQRNPERS